MASMANRVTINYDIGQGYGIWERGDDDLIVPLIDMANLGCGFHASDPTTMERSVKLSEDYDLYLGAHPSYPDLMGFGKRSLKCSQEDLVNIILYQLGALEGFCKKYKTKFVYVKPHGALFDDMMNDMDIFVAVTKAIHIFDKSLMLMITSSNRNAEFQEASKKYSTYLLYEAYLNRNYNDDGSLIPRDHEDGVFTNLRKIKQRAKDLKEFKCVKSINGKKLDFKIDTVSVHEDIINTPKFIKAASYILHEDIF